MALTALTLTNPGAEAGNTSGWTVESGGFGTRTAGPSPYAGTRYFTAGTSVNSLARQRLDLAAQGVSTSDIDAGLVAVVLSVQSASYDENDPGSIGFRALDASLATLVEHIPTNRWVLPVQTWKERKVRLMLPSGTRHLDVLLRSTRTSGTANDSYWDDAAVHYGAVGDVFGSGTTYALSNPGAEDGLWPLEYVSGSVVSATSRSLAVGGTLLPRTGARFFAGASVDAFIAAERIYLPTGDVSVSGIDAGLWALRVSAYFACHEDPSGTTDSGELWIRFLNGSGSEVSTSAPSPTQLTNSWAQKTLEAAIPVGARFALVGVQGLRTQLAGSECSVYWDDFSAEAVLATPPASGRRRPLFLMQ